MSLSTARAALLAPRKLSPPARRFWRVLHVGASGAWMVCLLAAAITAAFSPPGSGPAWLSPLAIISVALAWVSGVVLAAFPAWTMAALPWVRVKVGLSCWALLAVGLSASLAVSWWPRVAGPVVALSLACCVAWFSVTREPKAGTTLFARVAWRQVPSAALVRVRSMRLSSSTPDWVRAARIARRRGAPSTSHAAPPHALPPGKGGRHRAARR